LKNTDNTKQDKSN